MFRKSPALFSLLFAVLIAAPASAQDILSPQLRERVEWLKSEVARAPTGPDAISERAQVLWDWANAYALAGGDLPVNLTAAVRPGSEAEAGFRAASAIDEFVIEMTLHDERPRAIGKLTADTGPFEARTHASFRQVYDVGERAIEPGGGFVVTRHFMADYGAFQTTDPAGDGYVTISTSNRSATFAADTIPVRGMHGGFRGARPALFFRLSSGRLGEGDSVTILYGDRSRGGAGLLMPTFSSDRMPFPLYLDFDGSGLLFTLPIQPVRVVGTRVAGVHGFAPSIVRPGSPFTLSVRAQDEFFNRATGAIPGWTVSANGVDLGQFAAGTEPLRELRGLRFADEGVQRITIQSLDGKITGVANPILVSKEATPIYWGETHGHSGFAEGIGTPERFMTWAKEDARLDFVTHSEHDIWMDDFEWRVLQENVEAYSEEGRFIAYLGYEWTTRNIFGGHHNVLFRTAPGRERVANQFYPELSELYAGLRSKNDPRDVVVIPHAHQAGDYRMSDPKLEPLVEIMSQHGTFEWFGRMYLEHGHQIGFVAASDNHLSQPGYTAPNFGGQSQGGGLGAVLSKSLSRDGIFDALKDLRAYATTGERIILDVSVNGATMGQRVEFAPQRKLSGRVIGTAPISTVTVFKNNEILWQKDYRTDPRPNRAATEDGGAQSLLLTFESESVPMNAGDNPRGWRPWIGTVQVRGARIVSAQATDFTNSYQQDLHVDEKDPRRLHVATSTRGDASSIRLELADVEDGATLELVLDQAQEAGGAPPIYRRPAGLPAATVRLALVDMVEGTVTSTLPIDIYQDSITVRRLLAESPMEVTFEIEDEGLAQGDYYFVRVTQANDASAWSSPIWVGGYPAR